MKKLSILTIGLMGTLFVLNDASAYVKNYCTTYTPKNYNSYIAGRLLYMPAEILSDDEDSIDLDAGFGASFALGAKIDNFRIEGEMKYTGGSEYTDSGYGYELDITNSRFSIMLNGYYDFYLPNNFGIYVGGGLGLGANFLKSDLTDEYGYTVSDKVKDTLFVYQLGLGVSYALNNKVSLDLGYKYGGTSETEDEFTIANHEISMGVRYEF